MTTLFAGLKIGLPTVLAMLAVTELDRGSVSVQAATGVIVAVVGATWWLSGKLRQLEDGINEVNRRMDSLPCDKSCNKVKEEKEY